MAEQTSDRPLLMSIIAAQNDAVDGYKKTVVLLEQRMAAVEQAFDNLQTQANQMVTDLQKKNADLLVALENAQNDNIEVEVKTETEPVTIVDDSAKVD